MKRARGLENVALRLAKRECLGAPPGAVTPQSRRLYECLVPDTAVPCLAPPPNTSLSCFTPCGRLLLAFQPVAGELVAYRFKGLHASASASASAAATGAASRQAAPAGAPAGTAGGSAAAAAPQQRVQQLARAASAGSIAGSQSNGTEQAAAAPAAQQQQQQQQQPAGASFGDVFEEAWRCCPCPGRQQQLSTDFCLVAHGRYVLVATATPEQAPAADARGAAARVPLVEATTFHLVELEGGCVADSWTLAGDYVELRRNQGVHLRGSLLLVLGLASQTLHMLQLPPAGRLLHLQSIGPHCRDDDALVLAQLEEAERRLQRQRRQRAAQRCPSGALLPSGSAASLAAAAASGPAPPAAARAAGRAAADAAQPGSDSEAEASAGRPAGAGAEWAGGQDAVGGGAPSAPSPILGGLKQCLLAYLFREAQRESQEAAAAAAACSTAAPSQPPGGLAGIGGSSSLPNLQAAGSAPLLARLGSRFGSSSSLLGQGLAQGGGGDGGGVGAAAAAAAQAARAAAWRRPLDRFCFYFEAHAELLMWRAQLLDEQRLLIHWCAPEMLARPHRHHGGALPHPGLQGGSYLMLYNTSAAAVEQLFEAHSPELAAWYLQQPVDLFGPGCSCGCATDWVRCVLPPGGSRAAREVALRDPALAARELRHRLVDELPACSQARQATPYLDPDLYCFDERAVGGAVRPHHPPHRSLKWMCRCRPERLRFRLDPEHLAAAAAAAGGAGARAAAARAHRALYLFHPVQPFLAVALQDADTGIADSLAVFTRL